MNYFHNLQLIIKIIIIYAIDLNKLLFNKVCGKFLSLISLIEKLELLVKTFLNNWFVR